MTRLDDLSDLYQEIRGRLFVLESLTAMLAAAVEGKGSESIKPYLSVIREQVRKSNLEFQYQKHIIQAIDYFPIPQIENKET